MIFGSQTSDLWTDAATVFGRVREERVSRKKMKEDQSARTGRTVANQGYTKYIKIQYSLSCFYREAVLACSGYITHTNFWTNWFCGLCFLGFLTWRTQHSPILPSVIIAGIIADGSWWINCHQWRCESLCAQSRTSAYLVDQSWPILGLLYVTVT